MALDFKVGNAEVWGLQYHPEIPYDYMIKLIKHRSKALLKKNIFNNQQDIKLHIDKIEREKFKLRDEARTLEIKNWLNYIKLK